MKKVFLYCCLNILSAQDGLSEWSSTYLEERYLEHIDPTKVKCIVELGAYVGFDAILLHQHYHCPVYTFDCDQDRKETIENNIRAYPSVKFVPYGAWDKTEVMTFYHSNFPGSSSFFQHDVESKARKHGMSIEELVEQQNLQMTPQTVQAVRLDEWMEQEQIDRIDLLCVDVQGAALHVFQGLGSRLADIRYIITEADYDDQYVGQCFFEDIDKFLKSQGFIGYFPGDANPLYINSRYERLSAN